MITIQRFTFNLFEISSYVLSDETGEGVIIDPGMSSEEEEKQLTDYIAAARIKPVMMLLTHAHIDHIIGCFFTAGHYNLQLSAHKDCNKFIEQAKVSASTFGIRLRGVKNIDAFLKEGDEIKFGNSSLKVLHTPGHADGSVCYYSSENNFVITGDVLFKDSIGRTDLPTGNFDLLQYNIWEKLFKLPDSTVVYPGHGPTTTIGSEKVNNPFVAIGL